MLDWINDKVAAVTLTGALGLAGLQVITPMFVDLIFDGLIIGFLWVYAKTKN